MGPSALTSLLWWGWVAKGCSVLLFKGPVPALDTLQLQKVGFFGRQGAPHTQHPLGKVSQLLPNNNFHMGKLSGGRKARAGDAAESPHQQCQLSDGVTWICN